jgi:hypothetical protein
MKVKLSDYSDYVTKQIDDLNAFEDFWNRRHKDDPKKWPLKLFASDWREHFECWQSQRNEQYNEGN